MAIGLLWSSTAVLHYWSINGKLHHISSFFLEVPLFIVSGTLLYWGIAFALIFKRPKYQNPFLSIQLGLSVFFLFIAPHRQVNQVIHVGIFITYISLLGLFISWLCWKFDRKVKPMILIFLIVFGAARAYEAMIILKQQFQENQHLQKSFSQASVQKFLNQFQDDRFKHQFNIYHLSIDSYPNLIGYQRFGIDNSPFYQWLESKGFTTYPNAASNGYDTFRSLTMMWIMKLVYPHQSQKNLLTYDAYFGKNEVFARLTNQNYMIYCHYPCTTHEKAPKPAVLSNLKSTEDAIVYSFLTRYLLAYYFSNEVVEWFVGQRDAMPQGTATHIQHYYDAIQDLEIAKNQTAYKQAYFFLHDTWQRTRTKQGLEEVNVETKTMIEDILKRDTKSILIVSSDHGSRPEWTTPYTDLPIHNFGVMQAIRWPKACQRFNDVKQMTGVNFFRYIFACLNDWKEPRHLEPDDGYMESLSRNDNQHDGLFLNVKDGKFLDLPQDVSGKMSQQEIKKIFANAQQHNQFHQKLHSAKGEAMINSTTKRYFCRPNRLCINAPSEVIYPLDGTESRLMFKYGIEKELANKHKGICFQVNFKNQQTTLNVWQECILHQDASGEITQTAKISIPSNQFEQILFKSSCLNGECVEVKSSWGGDLFYEDFQIE